MAHEHEHEGALPVDDTEPLLARRGAHVHLTDLDTAAYLHFRGIPIASAVKVTRTKYSFVLYDPEGRADALATEFVNSACHGFADAVCRIKKVLHRFNADDRRNGSRRSSNGQGRSIPWKEAP